MTLQKEGRKTTLPTAQRRYAPRGLGMLRTAPRLQTETALGLAGIRNGRARIFK